ncbi:hypothetical protein D3C78_1397400 [compost metagenome]
MLLQILQVLAAPRGLALSSGDHTLNDRKRLIQCFTVIAIVGHHTGQFAGSADQIAARALQRTQHARSRLAGFTHALPGAVEALGCQAHLLGALLHALQVLLGLRSQQFEAVLHRALLIGDGIQQGFHLFFQPANHLARTTVQFDLGDFSGLIHLRAILLQLLEQATQLIAQNID